MNVLITSASRKVSLVRAFQAALSQEGGGKVIAVDASPLSPALYLADEHYLVPTSTAPEFLALILNLCERLDVKLIIPTRDEELPFFAEHKDVFAAVGTTVMVAEPNTIEVCQDKKRFIAFCQYNGFKVPASWHSGNMPADPKFPLFLKPRVGKGGSHTMKVDSDMELRIALEKVQDAIVQEYIQAPEYTIDLFADFSGQIISVVPRQRMRIVSGESFVGQTVKEPNLISQAISLATKLKLVGHNTIQCFFSDQKEIKFIEVNPRFGGAANLGFSAGVPTPLFLVKLLKGELLKPRIGEFTDRYIMLRYTEDIFLDGEFSAKPFTL